MNLSTISTVSSSSAAPIKNAVKAAVFTVNNYTEETVKMIKEYAEANARYCIMGFETAPTTGTQHIQGYIQFRKQTRVGQLAKSWKAWFNVARGSPQENKAYCSKGDNYVEIGEPATQESGGKAGGEIEKERWAKNIELAKEGKFEELERTDPEAYTRCYHTYKRMFQDAMPRVPDRDKLDNLWVWGAPGVGKSRGARQLLLSEGFATYYEKPLNKWWDGYQDEEAVIIDDLDKNHECLSSHLKHWADHYAFIGEIKGGSRRIRPKKIIVTSNYPPEQIFNDSVTVEAIKRRFEVMHVISYDSVTKKFV